MAEIYRGAHDHFVLRVAEHAGDEGLVDLELVRWRALQTAEFIAVGIDNEEGWVFTDGNGNSIHPHALYQSFRRIVATADFTPLRFHDLRHTHGSLLIKEGVPVKVISERLGQAHIAHTIQI